jgi:hypothetical protein
MRGIWQNDPVLGLYPARSLILAGYNPRTGSLAAFSTLMRDKLDTGDIHARKAYLRAVISRIEVGDENIRIIGEKTSLEKAVSSTLTGKIPVSGFVRKWCAGQNEGDNVYVFDFNLL